MRFKKFLDKRELLGYLKESLGTKKDDNRRVPTIKAKNLPEPHQTQLTFFGDKRLDSIVVAVVPDDKWIKGKQPSESNAKRQFIRIKQSYFETVDEIAWICHEIAHCQNFLDSKSSEEYDGNMQKFAFPELKTEYSYPNNVVEQYTFTKQFEYLKKQGKSRANILILLGKYYDEEDFPFFNKILDGVYGGNINNKKNEEQI